MDTSYNHVDTLTPIVNGIASVIQTVATPDLMINRIFTELPRHAPEVFSALINYQGTTIEGFDIAFIEMKHTFILHFYLRFRGDGSDEVQGRQYVMPFIRAFLSNIDLGGVCLQANITKTVYGPCAYSGQEYYGLELTLDVLDHQAY